MSMGNRFLFTIILLSTVLILYAFLGAYAAMTGLQYDPILVAVGFLALFFWISFILLYLRARRKRA
jgi:heme A synthase